MKIHMIDIVMGIITAGWVTVISLWIISMRRREKLIDDFIEKELEVRKAQAEFNNQVRAQCGMLLEVLLNSATFIARHAITQNGEGGPELGEAQIELRLNRIPDQPSDQPSDQPGDASPNPNPKPNPKPGDGSWLN